MTAMPQMVALYNGMGGGAAAAIAAVELLRANAVHQTVPLVVTVIGALIGAISLSGSLIAWAKLDGRINGTWRMSGQQVINGIVFLATLGVGLYIVFVAHGHAHPGFDRGVLCRRADLRRDDDHADRRRRHAGRDLALQRVHGSCGRFRRLRAAEPGVDDRRHGRRLGRYVADPVDGESDESQRRERDLQQLRCDGRRGSRARSRARKSRPRRAMPRSTCATRSKVIIAPGYGLAVAQAQHKLYEFVKLLVDAGVEVKFAIHPVAGRMPGHMNVLLAEAGVPYDMIYDLEDINGEFKEADVAIVIGANDTVNPAARTNKSSPIYGMPILNVDQAKQVYVIKRGQGKGYSGVENELFFADNTNLVYGDAQKVMVAMIQAVKSLEGGH